MKILIATGLYPPDIGGPATYSKLLFDELPQHDIGVKVLSFGEVKGMPRIVRHFMYFLKTLWRARDVDVVYAQDPVSVGLPSLFASKLLRKKFVLKVVGDYAWEQYQAGGAGFISPEKFQSGKFDFITRLRKAIQKFTAKSADKVIVPSEYLKKIVVAWGVLEENIAVILNSFNDVGFSGESKEYTRSRLELSGSVLISVGRLVPWKGFASLVKMMPSIIKEIADARLYIAGSGPEAGKLKMLVESLNLQKHVKLLGRLPNGRLRDYIKASDLFVLNTGYEGLSHQLLEVMSVETPIITTNVGGNPEVIENGKEGVLVEHEDEKAFIEEITSLLKDRERGDEFAYSANKKLGLFSKEKMIKKTVSELEIT